MLAALVAIALTSCGKSAERLAQEAAAQAKAAQVNAAFAAFPPDIQNCARNPVAIPNVDHLSEDQTRSLWGADRASLKTVNRCLARAINLHAGTVSALAGGQH